MSHGVLSCLNFQNLTTCRKMKGIKKKKKQSPGSSQALTAWKELQQRNRSKMKTPGALAHPYWTLIGSLHREFVRHLSSLYCISQLTSKTQTLSDTVICLKIKITVKYFRRVCIQRLHLFESLLVTYFCITFC